MYAKAYHASTKESSSYIKFKWGNALHGVKQYGVWNSHDQI